MKNITKLLITILITVFANNIQALEIGDDAINFKETSVNGKLIDLKEFKGKKAIWLVFWATWCPNCKEEIPALKKLHKNYSDKLEIIGINVGINDSVSRTKKYIKKYNIPYDVIYSNKIANNFNIMGTPTQVVIDINGKVSFIGVNIPEDITQEDINGLLNK